MRDRLHHANLPSPELTGLGERHANWDPSLVEPTLVAQPTILGGGGGHGVGNGSVGSAPHHGLIGIVVLAVLVLFLLDKAGFRFAVTVGKR